MNDLLKQRILRSLEALSDERAYQVLDYVEFLESKYAERQRPTGIFARLSDAVEDTMRAGKLPVKAITGTMGFVDGASKVMKGLAAAGQAVVDEAVKVVDSGSTPSLPAETRDARRETRDAVGGRETGRALTSESRVPSLEPKP